MQVASECNEIDVQLPASLRRSLDRRAVDNRRSLNDEILARLEDSVRRQDKTETENMQRPLGELLEGSLWAARNVSASVGLLGDLFGEMGIARRDGDAKQLSRALEVIRHEAERVEAILDQALNQL